MSDILGWDDNNLDEIVTTILAAVERDRSNNTRPYITTYQIAIRIARWYSVKYKSLVVAHGGHLGIGGKDSEDKGQKSLADKIGKRLLALSNSSEEVSTTKSHGRLKGTIEGSYFSYYDTMAEERGQEQTDCLYFIYNEDEIVPSSKKDTSIFRFVENE